MNVRKLLAAAMIGTACLGAVGCKPALLPGTTVEDTADNRAVVDFMERYREAIERRSADDILALVAPDYFEDNATVEQADDYGVEGLRAHLVDDFQKTKQIQLELLVQNIEFDEGKVNVDYRYRQRALLTLPAGDKWVTHTDVNRIVLREDESARGDTLARFRIVSGL